MANKVIAIWGSNASGKTVTSVKIATVLALRKSNIVLVGCDPDTPVLPVLMPTESETSSLGDLLALPNLTDITVLQHCVPFGKSRHIGILSYGRSENIRTYPDYNLQRAKELISLIRKVADFTIIDCTSRLAKDVFTDASLEEADITLKIVNPDLKSIAFLKSQSSLLQNSRYHFPEQVNVINNIQPWQDEGPIYEFLGNNAYKLPHVPALQEQLDSGKLLETPFGKNAKDYMTSIMTLVEEVVK